MDDWRAALLADMESLAKDFGRLFLSDCKCIARTERTYWPSRYPEPRKQYHPAEPNGEWKVRRFGSGVEVDPLGMRSIEDVESASLFYDVSGRPVVNSVGDPLIRAPGWRESNDLWISGQMSDRAAETIDRANDLFGTHTKAIFSVLKPPGPSLLLHNSAWPSVVNFVADTAGWSSLQSADWYVAADRNQTFSLEVWRRRDEWGLGEPIVDPEIAEGIGDEPEKIYADRPAFLRDSELALEYLIERLRDAMEPETGADDPGGVEEQSIPREALKAIVDGGLSGVLGAAGGMRAADRVSETMFNMLAADSERYWWSLKRWIEELSQAGINVAKKTILGNSKQGVPPCEAWSHIRAWQASNKRARAVSEETGQKNLTP